MSATTVRSSALGVLALVVGCAEAYGPSTLSMPPHAMATTIATAHRPACAPAMMAAPPPPPSAFYRRPSAALERGGGFYVPGLEGTRLRVAVAGVLSLGLVLNRVLSPGEPTSSQVVSEALGAFGCLLVFAQSAQQGKLEAEIEADALRAAFAERLAERQEVSDELASNPLREARARWAAGALLRLTPARAVVWVGGGGGGGASEEQALLRFGRFPDRDAAAPTAPADALRALLPASASFINCPDLGMAAGTAEPPSPLPSNSASAALCKCGDGVLAIASERPFAFSPKHERWLQSCVRLIDGA